MVRNLAAWGQPHRRIVELVRCIERFWARPIREGDPELAADMTEPRRGVDLIELKFSEMASSFAATELSYEWGRGCRQSLCPALLSASLDGSREALAAGQDR